MTDKNCDVRGRLRDDAAQDYELLKGAFKSALESDRPLRRRCEKCGHHNEFAVPDYRARVDAAGKWVEMGFGKAPADSQDDEFDLTVPVPEDPDERREYVKRLTAAYPDEVKSVRKRLGLPDAA
jgi:hypothetical protein